MKDYWETIKTRLRSVWRPGEHFRCIEVVRQPDRTCELCGHTPITWNHVLQNMSTDRKLIVGSECVHNIHVAARQLEGEVRIVYPQDYAKAAAVINRKHPGTVLVVPFTDFQPPQFDAERFAREFDHVDLFLDKVDTDPDDLAPDGMGSDEFDFEAFDYEARD